MCLVIILARGMLLMIAFLVETSLGASALWPPLVWTSLVPVSMISSTSSLPASGSSTIFSNPSYSSSLKTASTGEGSSKISGSPTVIRATVSSEGSERGRVCSTTCLSAVTFHLPFLSSQLNRLGINFLFLGTSSEEYSSSFLLDFTRETVFPSP